MSYELTNRERQIALDQLTFFDTLRRTSRVVPIPPKNRGEPERWVAVQPRTLNIQTDIQQPDPEKDVLCGRQNIFGCVNYCYGDKILCYIISSIIFMAIFSVITTPLLLLCCIPMIRNLVKV